MMGGLISEERRQSRGAVGAVKISRFMRRDFSSYAFIASRKALSGKAWVSQFMHPSTISLDDFGTGYSSLSYLGRFPIDQIKIDQSFVRQIQTDAATASIIRSIIMLGQSLGLSIIAEGVETQEQRDLLHAQGCTLYQGFWYGRPMPGEQFAALLQTPLPAS